MNRHRRLGLKQLGRYQEILLQTGRHGLACLIESLSLRFFPRAVRKPLILEQFRGSAPEKWWSSRFAGPGQSFSGAAPGYSRHLRLLLQDLGPTFIKLGQVLSCRPDLVREEVATELAKLQDTVTPISTVHITRLIEKELGHRPENLFKHFDYNPLAAASIAQVHRAVLPDGQEVAVKVQRPYLRQQVDKDLACLEHLCVILGRSALGSIVNLEETVSLFEHQLERELNFRTEGLTMEAFAEACGELPGIVVPGVHWQYVSSRILTMDYLPGCRIEDWLASSPLAETRAEMARTIMRVLLEPFFHQGIYHGDPHPGNILFLAEGGLGLVDFGISGRVNRDFRREVARLFLALAEQDCELAAGITLSLGQPLEELRPADLFTDMAELVDKSRGLARGTLGLSDVIGGMVSLARKHSIRMPGAFFALGRMVATGESLARRLDPEIDVLTLACPAAVEYLREYARPRMKAGQFYDKTGQTLKCLTEVPLNLGKLSQQLVEGEFSTIFVHRGLEGLFSTINAVSVRLALSFITGSWLAGSAIVIHARIGPLVGGIPLVGLSGLAIAAGLSLWLVLGMLDRSSFKRLKN